VRESPIGLGFRVPLVIVSPWSRGGWVCSEVFDHTSTLQFLEKFLSAKYSKKIEESNITGWRRAICGDLTSAFRPYNNEKIATPASLQRNAVIESIHKAKFKKVPSNYKKLTAEEIEKIRKNPQSVAFMPKQEKGIRSSCALAYELYADGQLSADKQTFEMKLKAGNELFGKNSLGSPFNVYAPGIYKNAAVETWAYTATAGDTVADKWAVSDFENGNYHLQVYGPNGFFREFTGNSNDPAIEILCDYEHSKVNAKKLTGNILVKIKNNSGKALAIEIADNSYKNPLQTKTIAGESSILLKLDKSFNWYDFTVRIKGNKSFQKRYAGHVETGAGSKSDPAMGRVV